MHHLLHQAENGLRGLGESQLARSWAGLRETFSQPELRVVVFGEFNRGKSTLINALLGRVVLPAKLIPTTGHVTRLVYAATEEVRIRYRDGRSDTCPLARLDAFSNLDAGGRAREDVETIEAAVDVPLLRRGVVLLDTPGVCEAEQQTARARQAIAQADLVLFLLDARRLLTSGERELAVDWLVKRLHKPLVPVVNFWNQAPDDERPALRARLEAWTRGAVPADLGKPWFEVNALGALRHILGHGGPPGDDTAALAAALSKLTEAQRRDLRRRAWMGQVRAEIQTLRSRNSEVLARLRTDARRLEADRAARRADLEQLGRRLAADARIQRERLSARAEKELSGKLDLLTTVWLKGESKERLASNAATWYGNKLTEAVRTIEKAGQKALSDLAGVGLPRPEPLTVQERMQLKARLQVGDLGKLPADGKVLAGAAVAGAVLGTFLLPGVGTAIGAGVGGALAHWFGKKEPDYAAAYCAKAREQWADDQREVKALLLAQFDARVAELRRQVRLQLDEIKAAGGADDELHKRAELEAVLACCEGKIQAA